jgi:hypothetical protein
VSIAIDFEWRRDELGYKLAPEPPPDPRSIRVPVARYERGTDPAIVERLYKQARARFEASKAEGPDELILPRGGNLVSCRPLDQVDTLFAVFAGAGRSKQGLLDFVVRNGPLTSAGNSAEGESVRFGLKQARLMNDLLGCPKQFQPDYLRRMGQNGLCCATAEVSVVVDSVTGRPRLNYKVRSLYEALWLQLGQKISSGHDLRRCAFCGAWFEAGAGTTRRADAKFCSDEHRINFNSQKRGNASKAQ